MGPSLRGHASHTSMARPGTRETGRPATRDQGETIIVPSRTSSLHSRITQPLPATLAAKPNNKSTPKTLTYAYMVCGVGREPSHWVRAPPPAHGKIQHMKGAVGQFWLPEILGSSPRLEQDNEIARALHAAMRVRRVLCTVGPSADATTGLLPPRCRDLYWSQSAALCSPLICAAARFSAYTLWHCTAGVVTSRRETSRDNSRTKTQDRVRLPRSHRRDILDPVLLELPVEISSLQPTWRLPARHVDPLE